MLINMTNRFGTPDALDSFFDVAVVGAGPMGSAAARHLSLETSSVALIGPEDVLDFSTHEGAWSGWADQGRAFATIDVPLASGLISRRAGRRFAGLAEQTGIEFTTPNPQLTIAPLDAVAPEIDDPDFGVIHETTALDYRDPTLLLQRAADLGVRAEYTEKDALASYAPTLTLPAGHYGIYQPDSFIINPRRLVAAQIAAAQSQGVTRVVDEAASWSRIPGGFEVVLRSGRTIRAAQIVLAAGVYLNLSGLSPKPVSMYMFGLTVGLVEVAADTPRFPTLLAELALGERSYNGIIAPPIQYPDGKFYIKSAGPHMTPLESSQQAAEWVRSGGDAAEAEMIAATLSVLAPGIERLSTRTRPCIVSMNERVGYPMIGAIEDGVILVTEGENGVSMSDEAGRLAARLVLDGTWRDALPAELFAPRFSPS